MKNNLKYALLLAFAMQAITIKAQNIATSSIKWNSSSTFEAHTSNTLTEITTVTTSGNHVIWKAEDGTVKNDLIILETNGSWTDVSISGSVTYEIDYNNNRGTVQFRRDSEGIMVHISLTIEDRSQIYELSIDNLELL